MYVLVFISLTILSVTSTTTKNEILCRENHGKCHDRNILPFNTTDDINQFHNKRLPRQTGACVLPLHPDNGMYEVSNIPNTHPGQTFDYVVLTVSCRRGYGVVETTENTDETILSKLYCINGKWSQSMPKCVRFCKLEPDPSVRYMCHVSGTNGFKTCDKYVAPGTSVSPICNSPIYYSPESLLYMKCIAGTWDYVAKCKAECGRVTPEGKQLIIDGRQAKRGELPWHVGIYRKTSTPYKQICGGSLVSNSVIISAAHCFWTDVKKMLPSTNFAVAIGKLYRPWDDKIDVDAQKSDVKEIMIPRLFEGEAANFQEDIAIVIITDPFIYKTYVRPVCLNFDANFDRWQLQQGKLGKVAGWGLTKADGHASQVLKVVEIPFVNADICINTLPSSFREYITGDKFCAGYTNGTALCKGDSGGGLAFADKELGIDRYYLRGIVSAAPKNDDKTCNDEAFTTFTKITKHEEFIKQSVAALVKKSCGLTEFQCSDGACVDQEAECNGKQECADGSDESDYLCKPESTSDLNRNSDVCILPPYPNHGSYKVANVPTARPGQFVDSFVLTVNCDEGYGIAAPDTTGKNETNKNQVYCISGAWYQIMPKCIRFCKVEPDPSVRFVTCQVPGSGFNICEDYVPPGTTVVPTCNTPNYFSTEVLPFMKCINGSWDYIAMCRPAFCKLDPDPNTRYMCRDAATDVVKVCDNHVEPETTVTPVCENNNNNSAQVLHNMTCTRGAWNYVAKCKTDFCNLDSDPSIRYMCQDPITNKLITCNSTVPVGTIAKPVCNQPYYYSTEDLRNMTCTDESWDYLAKCQPECGRITTLKLQAFQGHTQDSDTDGTLIVKREIIPWHVGIKLKEDLNSVYTLGTLVRSNVVITGAFRFYDVERRQVNFFTRYIAEVRESGFLDTDNHVQQSDVKSINVLSTYRGKQENFLGDIAVLILDTPFSYNAYVSPVCLDFDLDFEEQQLAVGSTGKVGYWGQLDESDMTVIDANTCLNDLPANLTRFASGDKICTSFAAESGTFLYGNFGAGVYFPHNESGLVRYYFRGMLHDGCYSHTFCHYDYAWSTRITKYKDFITPFLN